MSTRNRVMGRSGVVGPWLLMAGWAALGCAWGGTASRKARTRPSVEPRDTRLVHEDCPVVGSGATAEDINGDGRPDRRTAFAAAGPRCRALDFDFDGRIDAWVFLDSDGQVRRRENDFDRDGLADEVSLYARGVLIEQHRSTLQPGRVDTWHFYSGGRLARTERDANGDDYVDQWWEYPPPRDADCPLIHSDVDADGQPDPGATVDVCRDRQSSGPAAETAPLPAAVGEVPTQVESPAPSPAGGDDAPSEAGAPREPVEGTTP